MSKRRKAHTFSVTVSAPAWATKAQVRKEVRTLINDQANWGTYNPETYASIEEGDIKVRVIR